MSLTIAPQADTLRVTWADGASHDFHYVWLRDNCACPECRDPDAWERLFDTVSMPADTAPREVEGVDGLRVEWYDGHRTRTELSEQWLRAHRNGQAARDARAGRPVLWDASIAEDPPEISHADIDSGDSGLLRWMRLIRTYGFALVHSVPTEVDAVLTLAERMAFIQESNFGRTFHVVAKPRPENLAFTAHRLLAHTDVVKRHSAVNLQFLHCLEFDADGGESILVDGCGVHAGMPDRQTRVSGVAVPAATWPATSIGLSGPTCWPSTPGYHCVVPGRGGGATAAAAALAAGAGVGTGTAVGCRAVASCAPSAVPAPTPTPRPATSAEFAAPTPTAFVASNFAKSSRLPSTPTDVRLSIATSTSGGSETFSMMNRGTVRPRCLMSSLINGASVSAISFWWAARSRTAMPDPARAVATRETTDCRMNSATSSVLNSGSVPTSSRSSMAASSTSTE